MRRSRWVVLLGCVVWAAGCDEGKSGLGLPPCDNGGTCGAGLVCARDVCLAPDADFDGDSLSNGVEAALGLDPLRADTDGDGAPDAFEAPEGAARDRDADGVIDALERSDADADRDCIPDDADPDDATPTTDPYLWRAQCRFAGACVNTFLRQAATCVDGVLSCTLDGQPYAEEVCGNALDDDCDGYVDEGCAGASLGAGPFVRPAAQAGDAPGSLVIEKPFQLVVPTRGPLPDALTRLELDWVTEIEARCVEQQAGMRPPRLTFKVTAGEVGLAGAATSAPEVLRDARGRPSSLTGAGRLSGALALEHLAGRWAVLEIACTDEASTRGTLAPALSVPVRIAPRGPGGKVLPPRTRSEGAGCSAAGGLLAPLLALGVLGRARRPARRRAPPRRASLAALALLLAGCPAGPPPATVLWEGAGEPNAQPLWPLGGDAQASPHHAVLEGAEAFPLAGGLTVRSSRRVPGGVEHRFDRSFSNGRAGLAVLVTEPGDVYVTASHYGVVDPPMLLVPRTVRVGMTWEVERQVERDSLRHYVGEPLQFGDGRWRFTVSARQAVSTRWGERTLWRIEWLGPELPYAVDAFGDVAVRSITGKMKVAERARLRGAFDFVEGAGPVDGWPSFHALDGFAHLGADGLPPLTAIADGLPADGESALAERAALPQPPDALSQLAGATPQEAPSLPLQPLGDGPALPEGMYPLALELTRSRKESRGELVLLGMAAPRSTLIDPDGNTTGVYFPTPVFSCARVADDGTPTGIDGNTRCPTRLENGARPWVNPDGTRWDTPSIAKTHAALQALPPVSRPSMNRWPSGLEPLAPFWHDGVFQIVAAPFGTGPLEVRAFGEVPTTDLLDWPAEANDVVPGVTRFGLTGFVGGPAQSHVAAAFPSDEGLALYRASAPWALASGLVVSSTLWLGWDGKPRAYEPHLAFRPGWSLVDGAHALTEVGQQGELRRIHVEGARTWAELLGRVELPKGHVAAFAAHLEGERYLVFTQEDPEFRITGLIQDYVTDVGLEQVPPRAGALHAFLARAPETGLADRDWALRQVHAVVGLGVVRVCAPAGSGLVIDAVRLGERLVEGPALRVRDTHCREASFGADDIRRTQAVGATPLWVRVAEHGWLRRPLPPLRDPAPVEATEARFALLRDGSRLFPGAWNGHFEAGWLPVSTRGPATLGALLEAATVADLSGAGLWYLGQQRLVPSRCATPPCIDPPYAPSFTEPLEAYVLADRTTHRTFWAPPGLSQPVSTGGLLGRGRHLAPDGTLTTLPRSGGNLEGRFSLVDWAFLDGTLCGQFSPAEGLGVGCLDEAGAKLRLDIPFADRPDYVAQEPAFLVRGKVLAGAFVVDVVDVRTAARRTFTLAQAEEADVAVPLTGTDGTRWWVLGGAARLLVGVRAGRVERYPLPDGEVALWSATATSLLWRSGAEAPRPTPTPASCVTQGEVCNGIDDDCDGEVDEGAALCSGPNATGACVAGRCTLASCDGAFRDCNGSFVDGCEVELGTPAACTTCDERCRVGAACTASGCGLPPPAEVVAGESFACARNGLGDVHCLAGPWPVTGPPSYPGRHTNPANDVAQVVAGVGHACVLRRDGGVACWGQTDVALGPGGSMSGVREVPEPITGLGAAAKLWAGGRNTCARLVSGELWCWGFLLEGLVTPAANTEQARYEAFRVPTRIPGWDGVQHLALSANTACGVRSDGSPACFGPVTSGSVTTFETRDFPSLPAADGVFGGGGRFSEPGLFAFTAQGQVYGLGAWHLIAALGGPSTGPYVTPTRLPAVNGAMAAGIGVSHACFLLPAETACVGTNQSGQLGVVDSAGVSASVVLGAGASGVAATQDSTCFAQPDGRVACSGKLVEVAGFSPRWQRRVIAFWVDP